VKNHHPSFANKLKLGLAFASCCALWSAPASADDIDIYGVSASPDAMPNILFFMDNTSNWSASNQAWSASSMYAVCLTKPVSTQLACKNSIETIFYAGIPGTGSGAKKRPWEGGFSANADDVKLKQGQVELRSLRLVLNEFVCSGANTDLKVKVGVMFFNDQGSVRSNGDRPGYIRQAVRPLTGTATTVGSTCKTLIDDLTLIDANITNPEFKGPSNADYGSALFEAFKYFGGYTNPALVSSSTPGSPTGSQAYGAARFSNTTSLEDVGAFTNGSKTHYSSPYGNDGECGRSYVVLVGNTYPNSEPSAGPARFQGLGYTPPTITADPSRYADEWSQFLANTDVSPLAGVQRVFTYAINVYKDQPSASQRTLLQSMADKGGIGRAGYLEVGGDLTAMINGFRDIITSVSATNSVFTATTLPVSTTTQGSYLNQLFIGMFRPDGDAKPRWVGNVKQYKLGMLDNGDVQVVDARSRPAVMNGGSGFFDPLSESFWSASSIFFTNAPSGTPLSISDLPDGQIVEKGGVAQTLRTRYMTGAGARKVYTLPVTPPARGTPLSATPFSTANPALTAFTADEIAWVRGENNVATGAGAEFFGMYRAANGEPTVATARPSIHGDILHSRPVAVNYGSAGVVVFYGANDGFLRAVNGNQTGAGAGEELWSFVAPEHYTMLKRQRDDTPELYLPSTDSTGGPAAQLSGSSKKDYAMDGPMGLFARYGSDGNLSEGMVYAAMRRGGTSVYAFDVSTVTAPKFAWKITNSPEFDKLAQTWSMPKAVIFPKTDTNPIYEDPMVIMGGGYDPGEDTNSSTDVGNRIYVINGRTGAKIHELTTDFSVPGDVTVVDTNADGVFDRGYVADVRGNVWRINMSDSAGNLRSPTAWTIKKIASLGGKVFHAPDVVVTRNYIAVLVGTGDREKPLMVSTNDSFFMIKDTKLSEADRVGFIEKDDMTVVARVDESNGDAAGFSYVAASVNDAEGCYIELSTQGEKVVNTPFTIAGATYFGTNRPTPALGSCTGSRGQARTYQFPLFCGVPRTVILAGGGMPPSPVGGLVSISVNGRTRLVPFLIGGGGITRTGFDPNQPGSMLGGGLGGSAFDAERVRPPISPVRKRNFWQITDGNR
jgi:type IV pilus assembly protein PilY1